MSHTVDNETENAIPSSNYDRIQVMKSRASGFAEPLRSIVMDIDENAVTDVKAMRLTDFPAIAWDNKNGKITLAGDSCHAMTM